VHSIDSPPDDTSPVAHATQDSSVVLAPVVSEYVSAAQVLPVHAVTFPPVENVPLGQSTHPVSTSVAPFS